jgi:predicted PurR-regulated permease PerM
MPTLHHRHVSVEVPRRTLFKIIGAVALVWLAIQLVNVILLVIVAVLLSVALNPAVKWVSARGGLPRRGAASIVCFTLLAAIGGFLYLTWSSLSVQANVVGSHLGEFRDTIMTKLPAPVRDAFGGNQGDLIQSRLMPMAFEFVRSLSQAIVLFVLAFILTLYMLIEGRRTYDWLLAFVPKARRAKVERTAEQCEKVISGYAIGNVATSIFATVFVLVTLSILKVPAALLLAVLAGLCDFVPVLGFIVSAVPAFILGLTVSSGTAIIVLLAYVGYHTLENYLIAPRVYGDRLEMSNVAVVLAFAIGAEIAGVVGALIALPVAAVYPAVESIWLRERLPEDTVKEHRAIERRKAG